MLFRNSLFGVFVISLVSFSAQAFELELGDDIDASLDSTVSAGFSVRAQDRDRDLVGIQNGGNAYSVNGDNGNLNYDQGDLFSLNNKLSSELSVDYKNVGIFIRGLLFYDYIVMLTGTRRTAITDDAKDLKRGYDATFLDAYITADFDMGPTVLTMRAGNMVLNWGESTFIQNGINTINPIDVSKLRVAGSELKDALTPVPMFNVNLRINENFSIEGFYQFVWQKTDIDGEGTYFSTNDFASPGGDTVLLGFGAAGIADNPPLSGAIPSFGSTVPRGGDKRPGNSGQFGFAMRYFSPTLNETEFGLYYTQLHSRVPIISLTTGTLAGLAGGNYSSTSEFFNRYPTDIKTIGGSFNTQIDLFGIALQGEAIYRLDQPIQIDDVELLFAGLSPAELPAVGGLQQQGVPAAQARASVPTYSQNQLGALGFEETQEGYRRKDILQGQLTATKLFGPTLGANQLALVAEWGGTFIRNMEDKDSFRYEGPGTYRSGDNAVMDSIDAINVAQGNAALGTEDDGFGDQWSWGYRAVVRATYDNAIGAVAILPGFAFSHDVIGTTPVPISNFVEGRMVMTPSLGFSYLENLRGLVSYTIYTGGGRFNLLNDRDFAAASVSYSF